MARGGEDTGESCSAPHWINTVQVLHPSFSPAKNRARDMQHASGGIRSQGLEAMMCPVFANKKYLLDICYNSKG